MTYSQYDPAAQTRVPWNFGAKIGPKRPFNQKQIWAIRFFFDYEERIRDRALFDLAIDSKLRGCGSRSDAVEQPDRMVFDLDPDEGLDFGAVKQAARDIRARLSDIGLVSFAMLLGGKGVHVVVPFQPGQDWAAHKDFSWRFAEALSIAEPDRFTANMSKTKRKGRISIDWLRNQRGATAVLPYSARARSGAPVSVPIAWNELKDMNDAKPFAISDAKRLLDRASSKRLAGWGFAEQTLPDV